MTSNGYDSLKLTAHILVHFFDLLILLSFVPSKTSKELTLALIKQHFYYLLSKHYKEGLPVSSAKELQASLN